MRKNQKWFALAMAAMMSVTLLSGCEDPVDTPSSGDENAAGYKIAVVPKMTSADWFKRMEEGISRFNAENGTNYIYTGTVEGMDQASMVKQMLEEDWDAICIVPFDAKELAPVLQEAREKGVVVITHEASSMDPGCFDYDIEAFSNEEYGTYLAQTLAELCNKEGTYIQFAGDLYSVSHREWCNAADAYFENHTNMIKLGRYVTGDDIVASANQTRELLLANPNIIAIQGSASTDIVGAAQAVEKLGLSGKIAIVGTSMTSLAGEYLRSGTIATFSTWDPSDAGVAMVELAERVLDARESGTEMDVDTLSLNAKGYQVLEWEEDAPTVLYGDARVDVTLENMEEYDF